MLSVDRFDRITDLITSAPPAARKTLQRQADTLRVGLKRLEENLPEGEGTSVAPPDAPLGSSVNSDAGLSGRIVFNERNFDVRRAVEASQAEKDFRVAEFYQQAGHPGAAAYYYELVFRRYPTTRFATLAAQRLSDLRSATTK